MFLHLMPDFIQRGNWRIQHAVDEADWKRLKKGWI